jgi:hypothetical protein
MIGSVRVDQSPNQTAAGPKAPSHRVGGICSRVTARSRPGIDSPPLGRMPCLGHNRRPQRRLTRIVPSCTPSTVTTGGDEVSGWRVVHELPRPLRHASSGRDARAATPLSRVPGRKPRPRVTAPMADYALVLAALCAPRGEGRQRRGTSTLGPFTPVDAQGGRPTEPGARRPSVADPPNLAGIERPTRCTRSNSSAMPTRGRRQMRAPGQRGQAPERRTRPNAVNTKPLRVRAGRSRLIEVDDHADPEVARRRSRRDERPSPRSLQAGRR